MSYICLMVNRSGAVAAADSRETFPAQIHLDWRQKCFVLPEQRLIWACCGPTLRYGVDLPRSVRRILRGQQPMEERFEKIARLVGTLTRFSPVGGTPGPFCLLAAQWEQDGFTVWNCQIHRGKLTCHRMRLMQGQAISLHAGAWHRAMPPLASSALTGLSYEQLRDVAQARVTLAIELDRQRREKNARHNQTIGGQVQVVGLRVKAPADPAAAPPAAPA